MKQIYEDLSDDTTLISLIWTTYRIGYRKKGVKKKSQRDVNKINKSEEVKKEGHSFTEDLSEDSRKKRSEKARKRTSGSSGNGSSKASREKAFHSIRFDHHHSGEKDRADRRKSNQQTPADRSPVA